MMKVDGSGARLVRTRPGAYHALSEQGLLEPLIVEVAFHELHHRPFEQEGYRLAVPPKPRLEVLAGWSLPDPEVLTPFRTQGIPDPLLERRHGPPSAQISGGKAPDLFLGWFVLAPELDAGPILEGNEQSRAGRMPVKASAHQIQLPDDNRMQQAADIGTGRNPVGRPGLLQRAGPAYPVTPLEHQHSAAGSSKVGGAGEAIVTRADHNDIPALLGQGLHRARETDHAQRGRSLTHGSASQPASS